MISASSVKVSPLCSQTFHVGSDLLAITCALRLMFNNSVKMNKPSEVIIMEDFIDRLEKA